jgi:diguanylate cyclase (GGDEF)-like protein
MVGYEDSLRTASTGSILPRRFSGPVESDYIEFSLHVFRAAIRAWHTTSLCLALLLLIAGTLLYQAGYSSPVLPLSAGQIEPLTLCLIGIAVGVRAVLCALSWRTNLASGYIKVALPLAMVGHGCINAVFADEIFGPHPGYLAAIAVYAFGAALLTGLQFRQSLLVNGVALSVLLLSAWHQPLPAMAVISVIGHVGFAMTMAGIIAIALERAVRGLFVENRRVGEMATRDGLTGLKNRRAFDEHLRLVWQLALRDKFALAVMLIDVDFFKSFNDSLGHQAGDAALQSIASVVAATARRPLDFAARYGGEELAVILFDVSREYIAESVERVQLMVEELGITHPGSSVSPVVTVSTGVAYVRPTADRSPQGAIMLADRGLYAAKRAGRNRSRIMDRDTELVATGVFAASIAPGGNAASG